MSAAVATDPVRPVVDVKRWMLKYWPLLAIGCAAIVYVLWRQMAPTEAQPADPIMLEREPPTTEPAPKLDPLSNFSKPLAPVAQALVGGAYADRAELVRRLNEILGTGVTDCGLYIGSDGVSWSVSGVWSAGHPSPVFAGCPWPPPKAG